MRAFLADSRETGLDLIFALRHVVPVALLAVAGFVVVGCGSDSGTTTVETTTEETAAGGGSAGGTGATLDFKMGEFFYNPKNTTAKAGPTKNFS